MNRKQRRQAAKEERTRQAAARSPFPWNSRSRRPCAITNRAGWIEFGRPPASIPCPAEPAVKTLRPEEGLMVLFPSYFYHRTIPFETDGRRISVAFDVMPQN